MKILVLNCGSSSIKYKLYDMADESVLAQGIVERIGLDEAFIKVKLDNGEKKQIMADLPTHKEGVALVFKVLLDPEMGALKSLDEIDAVGKSRGGTRNDEREATLNQLLTEMDGFEDNSGVIVIAATNRIEMIDEALLRSGRFDRRIFLSMPDFNDRVAILNTYLRDKNCEVSAEDIARMSVGFSGAALSTLVNEAAINALRNGESVLRMRDFEAVLNKVLLGKKKVLSYSESEKKIQAIYQGAKALSAYWFDVKFEKISLIEDRFMATEQEIESKSQMLSRIKVLISGMCKLEIDENDIFSNSSNDLNLAKEIASKMVYEYGMGNSFVPNPNDVEEILKQAKEEIMSFLKGTNEQIARISSYLLAYESVDKETLAKILNENY